LNELGNRLSGNGLRQISKRNASLLHPYLAAIYLRSNFQWHASRLDTEFPSDTDSNWRHAIARSVLPIGQPHAGNGNGADVGIRLPEEVDADEVKVNETTLSPVLMRGVFFSITAARLLLTTSAIVVPIVRLPPEGKPWMLPTMSTPPAICVPPV